MTTAQLVLFFDQEPFEAFILITADGRELHVLHPEMAYLTRAALSVLYFHPSRQIEVIDPSLIVTLRTKYPSDPANWTR